MRTQTPPRYTPDQLRYEADGHAYEGASLRRDPACPEAADHHDQLAAMLRQAARDSELFKMIAAAARADNPSGDAALAHAIRHHFTRLLREAEDRE